jgi:hypothetical protein
MNSTNGNNRMQVDMVDMEEAYNDPNAEIMGGDGEASVDAIPDLNVLTAKIVEILEYLEQPDVKKICETNDSLIRMTLINKYADTVPLKFIDLFMETDEEHKQESIERTLKWIEVLAKVKAGEADLEQESKELVDEVNQRYVYSKYGGKENFEKALRKELAKEQRKGKGAQSRGF